MEFQWDEPKRLANVLKHGIDFRRAALLFDGRPHVTVRSTFAAEERFLTTGEVDGRVITVVWTPRGEVVRFISVRRARDAEERRYRDLHS